MSVVTGFTFRNVVDPMHGFSVDIAMRGGADGEGGTPPPLSPPPVAIPPRSTVRAFPSLSSFDLLETQMFDWLGFAFSGIKTLFR